MIRIIDRNSTTQEVVQKVTKPNGSLVGYQYGFPGKGMTQCSTLEGARIGIGKFPLHKTGLNKPKLTLSSHA